MRDSAVTLRPSQSSAGTAEQALAKRALAEIRLTLQLPQEFSVAVERESEQVTEGQAWLTSDRQDFTDVPFWSLDPVGAQDLDQAMFLERKGSGYLVRYAIADLAAFVVPGGAIDEAAWRRVQTVYLPDGKVPLHPRAVSEGAASLLPGQVRPAYVWTFELDEAGAVKHRTVVSALVRSAYRTDYATVQASVAAGSADAQVQLLQRIGQLRAAQEQLRGGASLRVPAQEVEYADGAVSVQWRPGLPSEDWNAQISLMTGMAAAEIMISAQCGIVRTLPAPTEQSIQQFRAQAAALGAPWPEHQVYGEFLRSLDSSQPRHLALMYLSRKLFRGAAYVAFDGSLPEGLYQAALAAPYAHATAPLRRLVDRYVLAICASVCAGEAVPDWVRGRLADLPDVMAEGDKRADAADRQAVGVAEAVALAGAEGRDFTGVVVGENREKSAVMVALDDVAVVDLAAAAESLRVGDRCRVRVDAVDVLAGRVRLSATAVTA